MILNFKTGCLATGRATKNGGEMTFIGDRATTKYKFSIQISNEKDENVEWHSKYLDPDNPSGFPPYCFACGAKMDKEAPDGD